MILNWWPLEEGDAINVFPIRNSDAFGPPVTWQEQPAYYFIGLEHRMLICPCLFASDELLLERPGLYLKTNLPLGGIVYFEKLPHEHNSNNFLDDLNWMVDSYLFKFNSSHPPISFQSGPRYYVDYANGIPNHGPTVFDNARVIARSAVRDHLAVVMERHSAELFNFVSSHQKDIMAINYAETSLIEEVCTHKDFMSESLKYVRAISTDNPQILGTSTLTKGWKTIICLKKYNRTVLSFYMAAMKEPLPNSPGAYIGMYKNLYNVLEYLMAGEGESHLKNILEKKVGLDKLQQIIRNLKLSAHAQSSLLSILNNGERLSPNFVFPPLSENDTSLAEKIAERLYKKRNAALHSKKTFRGGPVDYNISPGLSEFSQLETDLAIIKPVAEIIIEALDPKE